jgi:hypothetical protein
MDQIVLRSIVNRRTTADIDFSKFIGGPDKGRMVNRPVVIISNTSGEGKIYYGNCSADCTIDENNSLGRFRYYFCYADRYTFPTIFLKQKDEFTPKILRVSVIVEVYDENKRVYMVDMVCSKVYDKFLIQIYAEFSPHFSFKKMNEYFGPLHLVYVTDEDIGTGVLFTTKRIKETILRIPAKENISLLLYDPAKREIQIGYANGWKIHFSRTLCSTFQSANLQFPSYQLLKEYFPIFLFLPKEILMNIIELVDKVKVTEWIYEKVNGKTTEVIRWRNQLYSPSDDFKNIGSHVIRSLWSTK